MLSKWAALQESTELDIMPDSSKRIASAALAAGLQVESAARSILQTMHLHSGWQGGATLSIGRNVIFRN